MRNHKMNGVLQNTIDAWISAANAYRQDQTIQTGTDYIHNMAQIAGSLQIQHPLTKTVLSERVIADIRGCFLSDDIIASRRMGIVTQQFIRMGMHNLESRCILDSWLRECSMGEKREQAVRQIWSFMSRQLNLSRFGLTTLPNVFAIPRFHYITICNLASNRLTDLPNSFSSLYLLTHLDLSCNQFLTCPDVITSLPCLEVLFMDDNLCTSLPSNFAQLASAKFLSVIQNPLLQDAQFFTNIYSIYQPSWTCEIRLSPTISFMSDNFRIITSESPYSSIFTPATRFSIEDHLSTINTFAMQPASSIPWGALRGMETIKKNTLTKWLERMICMINSTPNAEAKQQIAHRIITVITPLPTYEEMQRAFFTITYQNSYSTEVRNEHLAASLITLPLVYDMIAIQNVQELVRKYFQGPYVLYVLEETVRQEHSSFADSMSPQELLSSCLAITQERFGIALRHEYNPFPSHEIADVAKNTLIDRIVANIKDVDALCSFLARQHLWEDIINQRSGNAIIGLRRGAEWVIRPDASPEAELLNREYCEPVIIEHTRRILQEIGLTSTTELIPSIL